LPRTSPFMSGQTVGIEVPDSEVATLRALFAPEDDQGVADLVSGLAQAAFREYMLAITGERAPTGVRDLRELRLRLLADHLPAGLPSDRQVAELFHLTMSQARTLIAGTRARYPQDLTRLMVASAKAALRNASGVDDDTVRITAHDSLAAFLRDELSDAVTPPPIKRADFSSRYDLNRDTVVELCNRLGLGIDEVTALP
jgi:hypothetical protein